MGTSIAIGLSITAVSGLGFDEDAKTYIAAVEAADGADLEAGVRSAINAFVVGCKTDGTWSAIKASCILAGARTLTGALVPLKGAAPDNYNFVSGDYDRKTGLVGDGTTKYLNSNRNNNADPQDNKHISVWVSTHSSRDKTRAVIGVGVTSPGGSQLLTTSNARFFRVNWSSAGASLADTGTPSGFWGASRSVSTSTVGRISGGNTDITDTSVGPNSGSIRVFDRGDSPTDARLAFYSIGESLELALLDARITTLVTALGAAIP